MRDVPPEEMTNGNQFFLPHYPVLGRKLREVFDESFRDTNGKVVVMVMSAIKLLD